MLGGHEGLTKRWLPVTMGLVVTIYLTACFLPSIWDALSLVGATATTMQAWIIPALLVLAVDRRQAAAEGGGAARKLLGGGGMTNAEQQTAAAGGPEAGPSGGSSGGEEGAQQAAAAEEANGSLVRLGRRCLAVVILVIGVALFVNAFVGAIFSRIPAA
jgi:hypothetical protein